MSIVIRYLVKSISFCSLFVLAQAGSAAEAPAGQKKLPVQYIEDRFFVTPTTESGSTLKLFSDTGGGLFLTLSGAKKLKQPLVKSESEEQAGQLTVLLPKFQDSDSFPQLGVTENTMPVVEENKSFIGLIDGMLGERWFGGHTWIFDYPHHALYFGDGLPITPTPHTIELGFVNNTAGERQINFPRMQASIDGETLDMLFDTGATARLSEDAWKTMADGHANERATSFIVASIFERWRAKHPDWHYLKAADRDAKEDMIEVPSITVAGYSVGPVWFTRRSDNNFHTYMSQWMDKQVEGAIGGNAFKYFRITLDYPNARAVFEKDGG